jgi:hypothetical protein
LYNGYPVWRDDESEESWRNKFNKYNTKKEHIGDKIYVDYEGRALPSGYLSLDDIGVDHVTPHEILHPFTDTVLGMDLLGRENDTPLNGIPNRASYDDLAPYISGKSDHPSYEVYNDYITNGLYNIYDRLRNKPKESWTQEINNIKDRAYKDIADEGVVYYW